MTHQSMSELVIGLEAAGFVRRVPDPADGRAKLICLTPLGRRVVRKAVEEIAIIEAAWFQQMPRVAGSDELRALLQRVVCDKGVAAATAERRPTIGSVTSNRSSRLGRR
jgi:DNA-binding MarR family transcriptional regulator